MRATTVLQGLLLSLATNIALADTFVFTAIPDQDERRLTERFGQIADYLAAELDVEVEYIPVKSYAAAVSAFRNDQVQLAWFGGLTGVQARRLVPGSQAIAQGVEDTAFKSYLIAHSSTGLAPMDELDDSLQGLSFTFGSKGSTSGRLMPEYFLREALGSAPEDVFSRVGFSGDHSRTIALVESGAYELGVLNYAVWDAAFEAGEIDSDAVQVIWESPTYPDYQWTIRGDADARFGEGFIDRVQQALLNMTDPTLLAAFPRSGFVPASNADYAPIEDTAVSIGLMDAE
ncbi:putative selenate ABC transporter substrate-binding protein [Saccharospirillum sp. MSK14-1]|uniref:putative selenate ABC transporter substrate-binding protein n=1 Tax=Saccharospirillum sp. MSK14-1 TaxID=1897632 RepID=UPI000D36EC06|nr:putative selenate ABC transporter substrate-binding protein [Saccharospirillum sp. MSK14-1]PTY36065.1 putative selenate ABC transporter substrate-binding protein [Saccharospirillum sp. MSK14-1]